MQEFLPVLRRSPVFAGMMDEEILSSLHCLSAQVVFRAKHAIILREGDTTRCMGVLLKGCALVMQTDVWGRRHLMHYVETGDSFAEPFAAAGTPLNMTVTANEDCSVLLLDMDRVLHVCPSGCTHHHRLVSNLVAVLAGKTLQLNEKLTHMSRRTTREKLLSYLSAQSQKQGTRKFAIPYDRQQLADFLCVDRAAMSAELSRLQKAGVLETRKNRFVLQDMPEI